MHHSAYHRFCKALFVMMIIITGSCLTSYAGPDGGATPSTEPVTAPVPTPDPVQELRKEVEELRARIVELEKRLPVAQAPAPATSPSLSPSTAVPETTDLPTIGPSPFSPFGTDISAVANDRSRQAYGFGLGRTKDGFAVTYVYKGSQAEKAGLLPRDLIYLMNGQHINDWSPSQMATYLAENKTIKVLQGGRGSGPISGFSANAPIERILIQEEQSNFLPANGIFEFVDGRIISLLTAAEAKEVPNFKITRYDYPAQISDLRSLKSSWFLVFFAGGWDQMPFPERDSVFEAAKVFKEKGLALVVVCLDKDITNMQRRGRFGGTSWYAHDGKSWDNEAMLEWGVSITPTISLVAPDNILRRAHIPHDRLQEIISGEMRKPVAEPTMPTPSPLSRPRPK